MDPPERDPTTTAGALKQWAVIALLFTVLGLFLFSIVATSWLAEHDATSMKYPFVWEMTGVYTFLLLLPAIIAFIKAFPIDRRNFWHQLPLHLAVIVVVGVTHTLLMWGSRVAIYQMLGWKPYDYGDMRYRFLMEGQKQFLAYWLVFAVVNVLAYVRRNRERELAAARLERQLTEARLSVLKMQLNPHFLFNTLNMISSYVSEDPRTADLMIGHLSDFLRLALRYTDSQEVPLETELEFLNAYLEIMKARFEERLAVEMDVPAETRAALVPHLLLQPLVENSVTYCLSDPMKEARIRIVASNGGGRLRLTIEDNGPGLSGEVEEALGRGIGLSNTVERLRHLYGDAQRFEMVNLPGGGLRLALELPFRVGPPRESGHP